MTPTETDDPTTVLTERNPPPMPGRKTVLDSLTVRDHIATTCLGAIISAHSGEMELPDAAKAAKWAREYADAMLFELANKTFGE